MDSNSAHAEYSPESYAGWPDWLVERAGVILRQLADQARPANVAIHAAVRDLTELPGVTDVRLVEHGPAESEGGPDTVRVPVGPGYLLSLSGPGAARPEVTQIARLVACGIAGRLTGPDDGRARRDAVRYAIDMTDLRDAQYRLRIESARLRTLVNSIHLAILVVDEQLRIAEVNTAALGMMRLTDEASAVIGARLTDLVDQVEPSAREVVQIAIDFAQRAIRGGSLVHREEIRLPDGTMVEADYLPVDLDGRVRGHLLMGQDVTGRVAAQQMLEARNRELAELSTLKNEFLATVSHELRTPLTAASSLVEALAAGDEDEPTRTEIVDALRRNTDRLLVIVEYLLVLARLESNQLPLAATPIDTRELVAERVAMVREAGVADDVAVTEEVDDEDEGVPGEVIGDPDWLTRMVHYVISGAVATCGPGAKIVVRSRVSAGYWTLTVTGANLPTRYSGHLFAAIVADRNASSPPGPGKDRIGVGLGVTLAEAIAKRHGGELHIERAGTGSTIRISLPVR